MSVFESYYVAELAILSVPGRGDLYCNLIPVMCIECLKGCLYNEQYTINWATPSGFWQYMQYHFTLEFKMDYLLHTDTRL